VQWQQDQTFISCDGSTVLGYVRPAHNTGIKRFWNTNPNHRGETQGFARSNRSEDSSHYRRKELRISGDAFLVSLKLAWIKGFPVNFVAFLTLDVSNLCPPKSKLTVGNGRVAGSFYLRTHCFFYHLATIASWPVDSSGFSKNPGILSEMGMGMFHQLTGNSVGACGVYLAKLLWVQHDDFGMVQR
jgi:hypothetical protein